MSNSSREEILKKLVNFYAKNKISCDNFDCNHFSGCSTIADGRPLDYTGAEAHLGTKHGEIAKILVLSLDTGGGSKNIYDRTSTIESVIYEKANPHMKGTIAILLEIFSGHGFDNVEVLKHFAMTNAEKCSANDGRSDKLPSKIYNISKLNLNDRHAYLVKCPHPSARQGQWQTFRDISLPIIALYLRHKIGVTKDTPNRCCHDAG